MSATGRRRLVVWGIVVAAALAGLVPFLRKEPSELPVYVLGAQRMLEGAEIYRTDDAKPFTYPPFFALPFVPLVGLSVRVQRAVWYAVNLAVLAVVLRLLAGHLLAGLAPRARRWFWVLLGALCVRHVLAVFENQSHDMLVLWCTVAAAVAWARGQQARAGTWAGLGVACKATPALFAVPFTVQGSVRALAAAALVGAGATLLPDLVLPRADGRLWVGAWVSTMLAGVRPGASADLGGTWTAGSILNQSLAGTLYRLTTPVDAQAGSPWEVDGSVVALSAPARRAVVLAGQLLVLAVVAWLARRRRDPEATLPAIRFGQAAAVACGMVLLSPMSSKSHFGVLLLPAGLALAILLRGTRDRTLVERLVAMFLLGTLTTKGIVGSRTGNRLLAYGCVTWTAVVGLAVAARAVAVARRTG